MQTLAVSVSYVLLRRFSFEEQALDVHRDHGFDVFEAIPREVLPSRVVEKGLPHVKRQLQANRERHASRPRRVVS